MASVRIRAEDLVGISIAVMTHVALFAWLVLKGEEPPPPVPKSITVTLEAPVSADAGSPSREEAAAAVAPVIADEPAPAPQAAPVPPAPRPSAAPSPPPRPAPLPPRPAPPPPRPQAKAPPVPAPAQRTPPRPQSVPPKAPPPAASPPPRQSRIGKDFLPSAPPGQANPASRPGGGSRLGPNFLPGAPSGNGKARVPPGPAITPELRVSFAQAVLRQVRPNWQGRVPQGLDAEKLVSIISVELNRDGTIAGEPVLVRQEGINDANRSQARRHGEEAIRAVKLSAPFLLPPEAYEGWKKLPPLRFRKGS